MTGMNIQDFQAKWRDVDLKERSAAQEHFLDLCRVLGQPTPAEADKTGESYTFERGTAKTGGGQGFADVWKRNHFAWEYKGNRANLDAAYQQLLQYREDLENPPLLVVSDFQRFQVHTNFTGTVKRVHEFTLDELDNPEPLRILRSGFSSPYDLQPSRTVESVSEEAAERFGKLALSLAARGVAPDRAAHFLVQLLFCLFAEDVGLLPNRVFSKLLAFCVQHPEQFSPQFTALAEAMRDGGFAGYEEIARFNGGLFADIWVEPLTSDELSELAKASQLDWSSIEPAIIGTLFERSLDPARRSQLGAHYTGRADIERVVDPVVIAPLRRRWDEVREQADRLKVEWDAAPTLQTGRNRRDRLARLLFDFQEELASVTILDPACGSGNFLYVALAKLQDLEKEVSSYASRNGLPSMLPRVRPGQLRGLEINQYAQQLTQVIIWIGYLQWMTANGFQPQRDPVLGSMETIKLQDSLLDRSDPDNPKEAQWPAADYIIGNPPFLGVRRLRRELGNEYVEDLFNVYDGRVSRESDLVGYFFEKARTQIEESRAERTGLLATNSIRDGANRKVLERIKDSGDVFMAWSNEPWILDGAAVRISIVGFDDGSETHRTLDGLDVGTIHANLTGAIDLTVAQRLTENFGIAFQGDGKGGPFDISGDLARLWLARPMNPNGRPNSDVVRPWVNGADIVRRPRDMWIIDFGIDMPEHEASFYEMPFEYVREHVKPIRDTNNRERRRQLWWIHAEAMPAMRNALAPLSRFICTPRVAKHRLFAWAYGDTLPDSRVFVFARDDDYFFGVLHSRAHEIWSLRTASWHGVGNDPTYNAKSCFETFPFPRPNDEQREAIGAAAKELDERRRAWLNPEGADEATLKKRTLTNLYNARPTWLAQLHDRLDRAVWSTYGWDDPDPAMVEEDVILSRLLALNLERAEENGR